MSILRIEIMWQTAERRKPTYRLWATWGTGVIFLGLLLLTQGIVIRATLSRNIGALYLIRRAASEHLDDAEHWLTHASTLLEVPATTRLLGTACQARGDAAGAIQRWRASGGTSFAVDAGLKALTQADVQSAEVWQQEIEAVISTPVEWQGLGAALESRGAYADATRAYRRALYLLTLEGGAEADLASAAELYYALGHIYRSQMDDVPAAIEAYSAATAAADFHNEWHRMLTHQELAVLLLGRDNERAAAEAQQAVDLMPESPMGHSVLGLAFYAAYGDLEFAEKEIRIAIDLTPQSAWVWKHLGQLYLQAQEYELAAASYLKAAELSPEPKEARDMAAFILRTYLEE